MGHWGLISTWEGPRLNTCAWCSLETSTSLMRVFKTKIESKPWSISSWVLPLHPRRNEPINTLRRIHDGYNVGQEKGNCGTKRYNSSQRNPHHISTYGNWRRVSTKPDDIKDLDPPVLLTSRLEAMNKIHLLTTYFPNLLTTRKLKVHELLDYPTSVKIIDSKARLLCDNWSLPRLHWCPIMNFKFSWGTN